MSASAPFHLYLGAELLDAAERMGVGEHMASTLLVPSGRFNVRCIDWRWISTKKDKEKKMKKKNKGSVG